MLDFDQWFSNALSQAGLTAGEFAKEAIINRSTAYHYAEGRREPSAEMLKIIMMTFYELGVDVPSIEPVAKRMYGKHSPFSTRAIDKPTKIGGSKGIQKQVAQ